VDRPQQQQGKGRGGIVDEKETAGTTAGALCSRRPGEELMAATGKHGVASESPSLVLASFGTSVARDAAVNGSRRVDTNKL
jgi:hypothetical protein